jgi:hypothetical protein
MERKDYRNKSRLQAPLKVLNIVCFMAAMWFGMISLLLVGYASNGNYNSIAAIYNTFLFIGALLGWAIIAFIGNIFAQHPAWRIDGEYLVEEKEAKK